MKYHQLPRWSRWTGLVVAVAALTLLPCNFSRDAGFTPTLAHGQVVDGGYARWAQSPIIDKFVDSLTPVCNSTTPVFSTLGYCIPIAQPVTSDVTGDYYDIGIVDYTQQMHSQLYDEGTTTPHPTKLRGYFDLSGTAQPTFTTDGGTTSSVVPSYLGPIIVGQYDRPSIVTFENQLTAPFFLPVDTTYMGLMVMGNPQSYNRTAVHLHGGFTPWISDGTPFQWFTAVGDPVQDNVRGPSYVDIPGMTTEAGKWTAYYTNDQSSRFMFYHDHAVGTTRLNVYGGMAAGYLITDTQEQNLFGSVLPNDAANNGGLGVPLIIQDKTFVPSAADITANDPTWNDPNWGTQGDLWLPHVYKGNQDDATGEPDPKGRWDNGKWVYPPVIEPQPKPAISGVAEANMDTMVVNGVAYPYMEVAPQLYRFRILNAANDRHLNLQLYFEAQDTNLPPNYTGEADLTRVGPPEILQIGNEGGFLPTPALMNNPPTQWGTVVPLSPTMPTPYTLWMAPAERADIIIDFSNLPDGTRLILYNDAPSPAPMGDPRLDYFTGDGDQTAIGGAPDTLLGKGPNTRTIMEFRVVGTGTPSDWNAYVTAATSAIASAYTASQPAPIVPVNTVVSTRDTVVGGHAVKFKSLNEDFDDYGRLKQNLGTFAQHLNNQGVNVSGFAYVDSPTEFATNGETQVWTIANNTGDVHPIHFHLFNVQVVARTDWANIPLPVDPNELGWKETVRMLPGTNTTVAMKFTLPHVPFSVPASVRLLDPTMPQSAMNPMHNFGNEYVWHCHMLEHEEHDMMRAMEVYNVAVAPENFLLGIP